MTEKKGLTVAELRARLKGTGWHIETHPESSCVGLSLIGHLNPDGCYESIMVQGDGPLGRLRLAEMVEKLEAQA